MKKATILACGKGKEDFAIVELLKSCAKRKDISEGSRLHANILKNGSLFDMTPHVANTLISMYAKCGALGKAQEVFNELPSRNIASWNALMAGYAQAGKFQEVFKCFKLMERNGISPSEVTFTCMLKACAGTKSIDKGKEVHDQILARGLLQKNVVLGNALVDMYAKFEMLSKAQQVLEGLPDRNIVSWSALIAGYAKQGQGYKAFNCFEQMEKEGVYPDAITFTCILQACGSLRAIDKGKKIHDAILAKGLLENNVVLGTALVNMYTKCGALDVAKEALDELNFRNEICWSALIAGYVEHGKGHEALNCFERIQSECHFPDAVTLLSILKACGIERTINKGKTIHNQICTRELLRGDVMLGTALVDMYAKCSLPFKAREVLEGLHLRNTASWSALIAGYIQIGKYYEALDCFQEMQNEGVSPDAITFTSVLRACGCTRSLDKGDEIYIEVVTRDMLHGDIMLITALVDMYAKCGMFSKVHEVLDNLPFQNITPWNALISAHVHQGQSQEALQCFEQIQSKGLSPDAVTYICALVACGSTGAIDKGKKIHDDIITKDLLSENIVLCTALADMYSKCGELSKAHEVFHDIHVRDLVSWNALIVGHAQQGQAHEALKCFKEMQRSGFLPNAVTVLCLLNACNLSGLVDDAQMCFRYMSQKHGVSPGLDHFNCMVDTFGCTGHFQQALSIINDMPCADYLPVWLSILNACRKWGNVNLAKSVFDQTLQLDDKNTLQYLLMARIYSDAI